MKERLEAGDTVLGDLTGNFYEVIDPEVAIAGSRLVYVKVSDEDGTYTLALDNLTRIPDWLCSWVSPRSWEHARDFAYITVGEYTPFGFHLVVENEDGTFTHLYIADRDTMGVGC